MLEAEDLCRIQQNHSFSANFCMLWEVRDQREPTIELLLKWPKCSEIFVKISHLRLMLKARCDKYGYYLLISQHIIDIHQFLTMGIHINPFSHAQNRAKMAKKRQIFK